MSLSHSLDPHPSPFPAPSCAAEAALDNEQDGKGPRFADVSSRLQLPRNDPPFSAPSDFRVYRPASSPAESQMQNEEEDFIPTAKELRAVYESMAKHNQERGLVLRATREAQAEAARKKWDNTTIRIRFMDRTQLEKTFASSEKIRSVYAFVRGCLREDIKPIKFVLYQTPPKREYKVSDPHVNGKTLAELQFSPASVLLVKFLDDALNHDGQPAPLAPFVLARMSDLPVPISKPEEDTTTGVELSKAPPSKPSKAEGMPKWLKLGKKAGKS